MGFKILVRSPSSELLELFKAVFEDFPYSLLIPEGGGLDWSDLAAIEAYMAQKLPSIVINLHGVGADLPGGATAEEDLACVNCLATSCKSANVPLIHLSSFRVFGRNDDSHPVKEEVEIQPQDAEGKHLQALEQLVAQNDAHVIVRLGWLLGGEQDNVLKTIVPLLIQKKLFFVSDHHYGAPVQLRFVARVLLAMVQQILCGAENWGVFHLRSSDVCSEAEFSDSLVRLVNAEMDDEALAPAVAGADDDRRLFSANAYLDGDRCTSDFGIQLPSWRIGLKALVRRELEMEGITLKEKEKKSKD